MVKKQQRQTLAIGVAVVATVFVMINYQHAFADPDQILFEDDFDDNSIDEVKWDENDGGGMINEINNHLEFDLSVINSAFLRSNFWATNGHVTVQAFMSNDLETAHGIIGFLLKDDELVSIDLGSLGNNHFNAFDVGDTGITGGKDVKIEYDFDTFDVDYYYWNGSQWINMGTTNLEIGSQPKITLTGDKSGLDDSTAIVDDVFYTDFFYTTHYPEIAIPPPTSPPRTGGGGTTYADILESRAKQAIQNEISPTQVTEQSPLESLTQTLNTDLQLQSFLENERLGITLPFAPTILNLVISTGAIAGIGFVLLKAMRKI